MRPIEQMNDLITQMANYVQGRDWVGLESAYREIADSLAGENKSLEVLQVNVDPFQNQLASRLQQAVEKGKETNAKAIYFEYDLDNGWDNQLFVCPTYRFSFDSDDDWACEWSDVIVGERFSSFGDLYQSDFYETAASRGINSFLIARTVAVFARCCDNYVDAPFALCIGFHDQDPIMRIHEPTTFHQ